MRWFLSAIVLASLAYPANSLAQPDTGSLAWWVAKAKARREDHIEITSFAEQSTFNPSLEEAAKSYTILTAVPVSSSFKQDEFTITTWYRLQDVSILSRSHIASNPCPAKVTAPNAAPLRAMELGLAVPGGEALVDGVRVTLRPLSSPKLVIGTKYLFVVDICSTKIALPSLGAASVYKVSPDGGISPVLASPRTLYKEVQEQKTVPELTQYIRHVSRLSQRR